MVKSPMSETIRIILSHKGKNYGFFKLVIKNDPADFLIGIYPEKINGVYQIGEIKLQAQETSKTIQLDLSAEAPHISVHSSGQVHIKQNENYLAGPIKRPSIAKAQGLNIAVIQPFNIQGLPETFKKGIKLAIEDSCSNVCASVWLNSILSNRSMVLKRENYFFQKKFIYEYLEVVVGLKNYKILEPNNSGVNIL